MADQDKSQAATPHKIKEARKRGQVAKSTEVISTVVLAVAMAFLSWHGFESVCAQFQIDAALLAQAGNARDGFPMFRSVLGFAISGTIKLLAPFFGTLMLAGVLANIVQTGPILSLYPVKPDLSRLQPKQAFKRVFSSRSLFELGRTLVKFMLVGWVIFQALKGTAKKFYAINALSPAGFLHALVQSVGAAGLKIVLILLIASIIDVIFVRRQFAKKMRMSQKEVKDEVKQREGDPRIRSRLRKVRQEMRKRSNGVRNTRNASVVITNPTHLAVALRYEHGKMGSPQVVAKGAGILAAAMRHVAAKHGVPIVRNPPLARKIYRLVDIEQFVPESLYSEVARIIIWVFTMKQTAQRGISGGGKQA